MHDVMRTCLAVLFGLALTATGLWAAAAEEAPAAAMGKEMVLDPTTGKMVTAPEYGGTFTWGDVLDPPHCDPYLHGHGPRPIALVAEKLGIYNWGTDRDEWGFGTPGAPLRFATGALAESWEMVDPLTYVFNIRKGWSCPAFVDTLRVTREEEATMPNTHRPYAPEFRQQMVELVRSGRTPEELALEYEPSAGAIRNSVVQQERDAGRRDDGLSSDERQELRRLRRENKQLRMERDILKKAAAWFARESDSIPERGSSS